MRLSRPYIPLAIRIEVALRQARERGIVWEIGELPRKASDRLAYILHKLFAGEEYHLDHDPALVNRMKRSKPCYDAPRDGIRWRIVYSPDANDPKHLIYRTAAEHKIKTLVRGDGALRSDAGQRRYNKKVAKNRSKDKKRPGRWPKGRKLRSRAINPGWRRKRSRKGKGWPSSRPLGGWRSRAKANQRPASAPARGYPREPEV